MSTTLGKRVSLIRKNMRMSQQSLAKELNLSKNYISLVENDKRSLSSTAQSLLCAISGADENWLRTGEGQPFYGNTKTRESIVYEAIKKARPDMPDSFPRKIAEAMAKLSSEDWMVLARMAQALVNEAQEKSEQAKYEKEKNPAQLEAEREAELLQKEADAVKRAAEGLSASEPGKSSVG